MGIVYLAGQTSGSGVTAVAAGLAASWRSTGKRVSLVKPLSTAGDSDPAFFAELGGSSDTETIDGDTATIDGDPAPELIEHAVRLVQALDGSSDIVVVEGLPLDIDSSPVLAEGLNARVIGVIPYARSLGGETADAWRGAFGSQLAGLLVNKRTLYAEHDVAARLLSELAGDGVSAFGALPEDRLLLAPTVQQVVDCLGGVYFTAPDGAGALIEHFLIGGLITEWGGNYFGRLPNQAVIVRGGRIDIQMSALNFPLSALILTGCDTPSQYVYQRADDLDAPLIAVSQNTHETAAALESLSAAVTVHHPDKARRAAELLDANVDMAAMSLAVGVA